MSATTTEGLRAIQEPLKQRYRDEPGTALVTSRFSCLCVRYPIAEGLRDGSTTSSSQVDVPMLWRQYAFHGYLLLQRVDERLLESRLPPAIFYNLLLAARRP